jgi:hypothetical protein
LWSQRPVGCVDESAVFGAFLQFGWKRMNETSGNFMDEIVSSKELSGITISTAASPNSA